MNCEATRLASYSNWRSAYANCGLLARVGFYYTGISDIVRCHFCNLQLGGWESYYHPITDHMRWESNCPLMRRRPTDNIPIDPEGLDMMLPQVPSEESLNTFSAINRIINTATSTDANISEELAVRVNHTPPSSISEHVSEDVGPSRVYHKLDEWKNYFRLSDRIETFHNWPAVLAHIASELAEAGFYYKGNSDIVHCFSCNTEISNWIPSDSPWERHRIKNPNCEYVCSNATETSSSTNEANKSIVNGESEAATTVGTNSNYDRYLCTVCFENKYDVAALFPCGHVYCCTCSSRLAKCPCCRKIVSLKLKLYFP